jgi:hypothetical protein
MNFITDERACGCEFSSRMRVGAYVDAVKLLLAHFVVRAGSFQRAISAAKLVACSLGFWYDFHHSLVLTYCPSAMLDYEKKRDRSHAHPCSTSQNQNYVFFLLKFSIHFFLMRFAVKQKNYEVAPLSTHLRSCCCGAYFVHLLVCVCVAKARTLSISFASS